MFKFLVCLVVVAVAEDLGEPGLHFDYGHSYAPKYENYEPHDYQFNYGVSDPHTGDHKAQWEVKEKGVVRGGYSLLEPDGTTRVVEYIADDHGFRAVVKKLGTSIHPEQVEAHGFEPAPQVAPQAVHVPEPLPQEPIYHAYDGQIDNYAHVLGAAVKHLEPASYEQPIEIPHSIELHGYQHQEPIVPQPNPLIGYHQTQPNSYTHQLPHESQGYLNNLQTTNYPALSSGEFGHQYQPGHLVSHPQAVGYALNKPAISQHQGQYYQGVAPQQEFFPAPVLKAEVAPQQEFYPAPVGKAQVAPQQEFYPGLVGKEEQEFYPAPVVKAEVAPQQEFYPASAVKAEEPHYQDNEYYHGASGNSDEDSAYNTYGDGNHNGETYGYAQDYQGDYSEKVHKVVPLPLSKVPAHSKTAQPASFLINYP